MPGEWPAVPRSLPELPLTGEAWHHLRHRCTPVIQMFAEMTGGQGASGKRWGTLSVSERRLRAGGGIGTASSPQVAVGKRQNGPGGTGWQMAAHPGTAVSVSLRHVVASLTTSHSVERREGTVPPIAHGRGSTRDTSVTTGSPTPTLPKMPEEPSGSGRASSYCNTCAPS